MTVYQSETSKKYSKKPLLVKPDINGYIRFESHNGKVLFYTNENSEKEAIKAFEKIKPLGFWSQVIYQLTDLSNKIEDEPIID